MTTTMEHINFFYHLYYDDDFELSSDPDPDYN